MPTCAVIWAFLVLVQLNKGNVKDQVHPVVSWTKSGKHLAFMYEKVLCYVKLNEILFIYVFVLLCAVRMTLLIHIHSPFFTYEKDG